MERAGIRRTCGGHCVPRLPRGKGAAPGPGSGPRVLSPSPTAFTLGIPLFERCIRGSHFAGASPPSCSPKTHKWKAVSEVCSPCLTPSLGAGRPRAPAGGPQSLTLLLRQREVPLSCCSELGMTGSRRCCGKPTVPGKALASLWVPTPPPRAPVTSQGRGQVEEETGLQPLSELGAANVDCPGAVAGFVGEITLARHHFFCACSIK